MTSADKNKSSNHRYSHAYPPPKSLCVCGSGNRFKRCCRPLVEERSEETNEVKKARRAYTDYWLQYTAHLAYFPKEAVQALENVDAAAFIELAESLLVAVFRKDGGERARQTITCLQKFAPWTTWPARSAYLRALTEMIAGNWLDSARKPAQAAFATISADRIEEAEALQLYWQLHADQMQFGQRLSFLERLIATAKTGGTRLQYRMNRALQYALSNDRRSASEEISSSIQEFEARAATAEPYDLMWHAMALVEAGNSKVEGIEEPFRRAQETFARLLENPDLPDWWRAHILALSGEALIAAGQPEAALQSLHASSKLEENDRTTILTADALLELNQWENARAMLLGQDYSRLTEALQFDWSVAFAEVSLRSRSVADLEVSRTRIEALRVPHATLIEKLRELQSKIAARQYAMAQAEVNELRQQLRQEHSTDLDSRITASLATYQTLPPRRQVSLQPRGYDLAEFLLEIVVEASAKLLDQKQLLSHQPRSLEDVYTGFLFALLQQRVESMGWSGSDQNLGGRPATDSPERGRRDIAFWKGADAPFWFIEAVRCSSMGSTEAAAVREHAERLIDRYDHVGSSHLTLIVFADVANFTHFTASYITAMSTDLWQTAPVVAAPETQDNWRNNGYARQRLTPLLSRHQHAGRTLPLTHLLVHTGR